MAVKMTGIQRLRYYALIARHNEEENPFKHLMMQEIITGNMVFSDPDSVGNPENIVDTILGIAS